MKPDPVNAGPLQTLKENRSGLLLATLVLFLVVHPLTAEGGPGRILFGILGTFVVLSAVYAVAANPRHFMIALVLAVIALAGTWIAQAADTTAMWIFGDLSMVVLYAYVTAILLSYVLRHGRVTADKLFAAVCVYFFFGLLFARAYHAMEIGAPDSFSGLSGETAMATDDLTYFSFVTLTTLGYGDITPKSDVARCFVVLQAALGVLYLAILISRLAGSYRRHDHHP